MDYLSQLDIEAIEKALSTVNNQEVFTIGLFTAEPNDITKLQNIGIDSDLLHDVNPEELSKITREVELILQNPEYTEIAKRNLGNSR